jgi:hypothetical protein
MRFASLKRDLPIVLVFAVLVSAVVLAIMFVFVPDIVVDRDLGRGGEAPTQKDIAELKNGADQSRHATSKSTRSPLSRALF